MRDCWAAVCAYRTRQMYAIIQRYSLWHSLYLCNSRNTSKHLPIVWNMHLHTLATCNSFVQFFFWIIWKLKITNSCQLCSISYATENDSHINWLTNRSDLLMANGQNPNNTIRKRANRCENKFTTYTWDSPRKRMLYRWTTIPFRQPFVDAIETNEKKIETKLQFSCKFNEIVI